MSTPISFRDKIINRVAEIKNKISRSNEALGQTILVAIVILILVTNIRLIMVTTQLNARLATIDIQLQRLEGGIRADRSGSFDPASSVVVDVSWKGAPTRGSLDAPIQIVEFSDFQCPFCASSQPILDLIFEEYEGQVLLAYRHFPLPGHAQAIPAAEAAECAKEQGKFWEMHDLIFENTQQLSQDPYRVFAEQLRLDIDQFEICLSEDRYIDGILNDLEDGQRYGVTGTPAFFINGYLIPGTADLARFHDVIDAILASSKTER
jgi:predicted DsbA family dithiol-disulfide isomerase